MDAISNVDRLVMVLRQRLMERARLSTNKRDGSRRAASGREPGGVEQAQALAALKTIDDDQLRRALIQGVLRDHFGPALLNDAKFQQVVDRVTETLNQEPALADLFTRVLRELRQSA